VYLPKIELVLSTDHLCCKVVHLEDSFIVNCHWHKMHVFVPTLHTCYVSLK